MSKIIKPKVGRVVHFYPNGNQFEGIHDQESPSAAIITHVWSDRMVNLTVFGQNGVAAPATSIALVQPGDESQSEGSCYCEWMPYQIKLDAKTSVSGVG